MNARAIGVVRSQVRERKAMPSFGAPASVEVFPEFRNGLHRMEKHSHIWVLAWLDQAERELLQVTPRGVSDAGPEGLHGVFAVRSPARPNPIGLTAAQVLRVRDGTVDVDLLDFLDGTKVIDIKPYFSSRDIIFSASNVQIGRPSSREAMRDSLLRQALRFHGERCPDLALAARIVEHFRFEALRMNEPEEWRITVPLNRGCLIDAFIGITRATPGRGGLQFGVEDAVQIRHGKAVFVYRLNAASPGDYDSVSAAPDADIFQFEIAS
jgi:tRNA-Thr(GGU) m(6)t(6)A37 methyltransferase TsaA